jgi:hypothetical protein
LDVERYLFSLKQVMHCTRPLGRPQGDMQGSTQPRAELRLQVLQGSYRSNGCDTKNGNWKS